MRAQYYLGMMFLNGHGGVTASTEKAVRPAPRAASRGGAPGPPRDHPLAHAVGNQEAERERLYTSLAAAPAPPAVHPTAAAARTASAEHVPPSLCVTPSLPCARASPPHPPSQPL